MLATGSMHQPITAVGLRLSGQQWSIGCQICEPHICIFGKAMDVRGLHGLSCRKSAARQQRHRQLNDIIWGDNQASPDASSRRASQSDGRRLKWPDGITLLSSSTGKPMAWDVIVSDTYADSHVDKTVLKTGAAADQTRQHETRLISMLG